jgi:hypothetical protein
LRFLALRLVDAFVTKNSPLLVMLEFVDPNVLLGDEETGEPTPRRFTTPTRENQLSLAKLVEHGTNVNAVSSPNAKIPLHSACDAAIMTNKSCLEMGQPGQSDLPVLDG